MLWYYKNHNIYNEAFNFEKIFSSWTIEDFWIRQEFILRISLTYVGYEIVGTCVKVCSPKVVSDLKRFLAYKYIYKYEMYISKKKLFKKIYEHNFKNS
jgi:hypothetical protein